MSNRSSFRADIEGLRALAVLLVLVFHAQLTAPGGFVGVDVFFVISGFLITGLLLREAQSTATVSLLQFYARRAKRLVPAASVVLITSLVATWFLAPLTVRKTFFLDVSFAAAYVANFRFADRAVDYLAEDIGPSPVLHFWSLAVEEQFYFVWPFLVLVALWLGRRTGLSLRTAGLLSLSAVALPSLGWSVYFTAHSPADAFFVSTTRLWELSIGAALALIEPDLPAPRRSVAEFLAWTGLGVIVGSAWWLDENATWPSYWAMAPCLGTGLVIAAGGKQVHTTAAALLSSRPMVWVGALSYSLYLWHWPVLVAGRTWLELSSPAWGAALVAGSILPAWLSYRFVETPVRFGERFQFSATKLVLLGLGAALLCGATGFALAAASAGSKGSEPRQHINLRSEGGVVHADPPRLGAGALGQAPSEYLVPRVVPENLTPRPESATLDIPVAYSMNCQVGESGVGTPPWCEAGRKDAKRRLVLVGDSKILQYFEALDAAGRALDLRVQSITKSACAFSGAYTKKGKPKYSEQCHQYNELALQALLDDPPYAIITSSNSTAGHPKDRPGEWGQRPLVEGLTSYWRQLKERGVKIVVLLDNPKPKRAIWPVYECVAEHPESTKECSFGKQGGLNRSGAPPLELAAQELGLPVVDLSDYICPRQTCPPIVGNVLVYRQGSHLTNTYVRSLAPILTQRLRDVLERQ